MLSSAEVDDGVCRVFTRAMHLPRANHTSLALTKMAAITNEARLDAAARVREVRQSVAGFVRIYRIRQPMLDARIWTVMHTVLLACEVKLGITSTTIIILTGIN
jgi:hypothetical protein